MKIGHVNYPSNILDALSEDRLVIFAGAGVSMDPPANLPSFDALADDIATVTGRPRNENESPVDYFTRTSDDGEQVHRWIADMFEEKNPQPNSLHRNLSGLFAADAHAKIVTTNFDLLFEAVQPARGCTTYTAPALPPGHRFQGIVHLHGAVTDPDDMVVTLSDISRAYLMEGWALNFLKQMFSEFTVLFVGYSHDDIMMQYLARGMPAQSIEQQQRFALIPEEDRLEARWRDWGITPVTFPAGPNGRHEYLPATTERLAGFINRGPRQWKQRIQEIADRDLAPTDPEDHDTIIEALKDPLQKLKHFTEVARTPDWLEWAERNFPIGGLFAQGTLNPTEIALAEWVARNFATNYPRETRALIGRQGSNLNPVLWQQMAQALANQPPTDALSDITSQWASFLLNKTPPASIESTCNGLDHILEVCLRDNLTQLLLACYYEMCRTQVEFHEDGVQLTTACPPWLLQKAWSTLKNQLAQIARAALDQATLQLELRHTVFSMWTPSGDSEESDSVKRPKIGCPPEDSYARGVDSIIDSARDSLEWLAANDPDDTLRWCNRYIASDVALLNRLATFTIGVIPASHQDYDDKIDWILDNHLIYHRYATEEAKDVAESAAHKATEPVVDRLVRALAQQAAALQEPT